MQNFCPKETLVGSVLCVAVRLFQLMLEGSPQTPPKLQSALFALETPEE